MNRIHADYQSFLVRELSERVKRRATYSVRSFAKELGISANHLGRVLNHKAGLSMTQAQNISKKLGWKRLESEIFYLLVQSQHARQRTLRTIANQKLLVLMQEIKAKELSEDQFQLVSCWHNFAVLEFLKFRPRFSDLSEIASRLNVSNSEIQMTVARLIRLGLVEINEDGYRVLQETVITNNSALATAVRNFHEQILEKAKQSLRSHPVHERHLQAMFFPIRDKDVSAANEELNSFIDQFLEKYSAEGEGEKVYCVSTQLFKVSDIEAIR